MRSSPSGPDPLDPGPHGFAHRGLHFGSEAPENSLAAFERAIELGAGIECDVRLSGDRSAVVFHDSDLTRMCDVSLKVEQTPAALLEGQRLSGSNQQIPALSRVLEVVGGRVPLLLELKTDRGNAARLCRAVFFDLSRRSGPIGIMSFDPKVGGWLRRNAPLIARGLVIAKDTPRHRRWLAVLIAAPQFLAVNRECLNAPWVARIRRRMPVYAWTIRTSAERAQAEVQADALIWEGDGGPRN
jgi:glycerophosphoryl diester phosphodiesterase